MSQDSQLSWSAMLNLELVSVSPLDPFKTNPLAPPTSATPTRETQENRRKRSSGTMDFLSRKNCCRDSKRNGELFFWAKERRWEWRDVECCTRIGLVNGRSGLALCYHHRWQQLWSGLSTCWLWKNCVGNVMHSSWVACDTNVQRVEKFVGQTLGEKM